MLTKLSIVSKGVHACTRLLLAMRGGGSSRRGRANRRSLFFVEAARRGDGQWPA
jgi:hypothetical protein